MRPRTRSRSLRLLISPIACLSASVCPVVSLSIVRLNGGESLLCRDAVPTLPSTLGQHAVLPLARDNLTAGIG